MARRGFRKPTQRKSLRPRLSQPPPRTSERPAAVAAVAEPTQPAQDGAHALVLSPSPADPDEPLTTSFFSKPPVDPFEVWDDHHVPVMPHGSRRAMFATLAIFAVSVLVLGGYVAYARFVMPVPAELGSRGLPSSVAIATVSAPPTAAGAALTPPSPAPAPAPVVVAAAVPFPSAQPTPTADPPPSAAASPPVVAAPPPTADPAPSAAAIPSAAAAPTQPPLAAAVRAAAPAPIDPAVSEMLAGANALYQGGKRREALVAYQGVLAHDPNATEALSKIAYIYLDKSDNTRARRFAARAVELDPNSSEGWIVLGAALEALGDRSGARNAYRTCASLGSDTYAAECRKLAR